jgi:hypothetical protein
MHHFTFQTKEAVMQLGSKKRQLEGGLFRSNEEVEVIIREWLRMQESISLTTEYFI